MVFCAIKDISMLNELQEIDEYQVCEPKQAPVPVFGLWVSLKVNLPVRQTVIVTY